MSMLEGFLTGRPKLEAQVAEVLRARYARRLQEMRQAALPHSTEGSAQVLEPAQPKTNFFRLRRG